MCLRSSGLSIIQLKSVMWNNSNKLVYYLPYVGYLCEVQIFVNRSLLACRKFCWLATYFWGTESVLKCTVLLTLHWPIYWWIDWLTAWRTDWPTNWQTDWLMDWQTDWRIDRLPNWQMDWLTDIFSRKASEATSTSLSISVLDNLAWQLLNGIFMYMALISDLPVLFSVLFLFAECLICIVTSLQLRVD